MVPLRRRGRRNGSHPKRQEEIQLRNKKMSSENRREDAQKDSQQKKWKLETVRRRKNWGGGGVGGFRVGEIERKRRPKKVSRWGGKKKKN